MNRSKRTIAMALIAGIATVSASFSAAESAEAPTARELSNEEKEEFLLRAEILDLKDLDVGVTKSKKASLSDGTLTHDAHIQTVDIFKQKFQNESWTENHFKDSYKYNIAAYRLDKLLGLNMIPVTVSRKVNRRRAAVAWWVDDVMLGGEEYFETKPKLEDEDLWADQWLQGWVFQNLVYNIDFNYGNFLIDERQNFWMLDFTRAFRKREAILNRKNLQRIGRNLLRQLRELDAKEAKKELRPFLTQIELKSMLARRDLIIAHFDKLIEERGEAKVIIDRPGF